MIDLDEFDFDDCYKYVRNSHDSVYRYGSTANVIWNFLVSRGIVDGSDSPSTHMLSILKIADVVDGMLE